MIKWDEKELFLEILRQYRENGKIDRKKILDEKASFSSLLTFSASRANLIRWMDFLPGTRALEIGAGTGAITEYLISVGCSVICIDRDADSCEINRLRNPSAEVYHGDFFQWLDDLKNKGAVEDGFDCIFIWNQSLEHAGRSVLAECKGILKQTGTLILATNNRFGARYFNGYLPEYEEDFFVGLTGQEKSPETVFYSKADVEKYLREGGFSTYRFYYPYPDYQFPFSIYSDAYMPAQEELKREIYPFQDKRLRLFREGDFYNAAIKEGTFALFANSYMVIASAEESERNKVIYAKFSNERAPGFNILTKILDDGKRREICKLADDPESQRHVDGIYRKYELLQNRFDGSKFLINRCRKEAQGVFFEYVKGQSLEEYLNRFLEEDNFTGFFKVFDCFVKELRDRYDALPFEETEAFRSVFGDVTLPVELSCSCGLDVDLLFQNVLVDKEQHWNVIDYEWTFSFPIPVNFLVHRVIFFYFYQSEICREKVALHELFERYQISEEEQACYSLMEEAFQRFATEGGEHLTDYVDEEAVWSPEQSWLETQVFFDTGDGFQESGSLRERFFLNHNIVSGTIKLPENTRALRLDPTEEKMIFRVREMEVYREGKWRDAAFRMSGEAFGEDACICPSGDPQIVCENLEQADCVRFSFEIIVMEEKAVQTTQNLITQNRNLLKEKQDLKEKNLGMTRKIEETDKQLQKAIEIMQERMDVICEQKQELINIYSSRSWKITAPLRKIVQIFRRERKAGK